MSFYHNLLSLLWAFLIVVFAIPSIINVAHNKKLLDQPNRRTLHAELTPRLGGLAIFAGFLSALTIFGDLSHGVRETVAGSIILFFIGLKDDIVSVSAFKKFFVQVLSAGIVMFLADIRISSLYGVFGIYDLTPGISYMLTFIIIIGITNAVNLIDGVDGLAGSIVSLICVFFGLSFFVFGGPEFKTYSTVAFALLGSMIGFLRYNFGRAIIFMGDTGSLLAGFIIAVLGIKFVEMNTYSYSPALALAVLYIPILDTLRVFVLRILAGISPFTPDKNHLHHRFVDLGFNHKWTVFILLLINGLAIALVLVFKGLANNNLVLILIFYSLFVVAGIEILYRRRISNSAQVI